MEIIWKITQIEPNEYRSIILFDLIPTPIRRLFWSSLQDSNIFTNQSHTKHTTRLDSGAVSSPLKRIRTAYYVFYSDERSHATGLLRIDLHPRCEYFTKTGFFLELAAAIGELRDIDGDGLIIREL